MPNSSPLREMSDRCGVARPTILPWATAGGHRALGGQSGLFVDDVKDLGQRPTECFAGQPAGQCVPPPGVNQVTCSARRWVITASPIESRSHAATRAVAASWFASCKWRVTSNLRPHRRA